MYLAQLIQVMVAVHQLVAVAVQDCQGMPVDPELSLLATPIHI
jgi:hypothetical protein